jgi:heptosyltransferase-2
MKKILIIRLSSIGDIILTSPIIRVLRKNFPESQIDFVAKEKFIEVVKYNPNINKIHILKGHNSIKELKSEIKKEKYDLIIDMHKNFRSFYLKNFSNAKKIFTISKPYISRFLLVNFKINLYKQTFSIIENYFAPLKKIGIQNDQEGLEVFTSDDARLKVKEIMEDFISEGDFVIGMSPGAGFWNKEWTNEGFSGVIDYFARKYKAKILLFGSEKDNKKIQQISELVFNKNSLLDLSGRLNLLELIAGIEKCNLFITNDTGAMHIAVALKKKVIAIFGPTTKEFGFFPNSKESLVVENFNLSCRPCTHIGKDYCPKKHFKCMRDVKSWNVIEVAEKLLNKN